MKMETMLSNKKKTEKAELFHFYNKLVGVCANLTKNIFVGTSKGQPDLYKVL